MVGWGQVVGGLGWLLMFLVNGIFTFCSVGWMSRKSEEGRMKRVGVRWRDYLKMNPPVAIFG